MAETAVQWGLYLAVLDPVVGSEQPGRRPVLVVSRETVNRTLTITVTSG